MQSGTSAFTHFRDLPKRASFDPIILANTVHWTSSTDWSRTVISGATRICTNSLYTRSVLIAQTGLRGPTVYFNWACMEALKGFMFAPWCLICPLPTLLIENVWPECVNWVMQSHDSSGGQRSRHVIKKNRSVKKNMFLMKLFFCFKTLFFCMF